MNVDLKRREPKFEPVEIVIQLTTPEETSSFIHFVQCRELMGHCDYKQGVIAINTELNNFIFQNFKTLKS